MSLHRFPVFCAACLMIVGCNIELNNVGQVASPTPAVSITPTATPTPAPSPSAATPTPSQSPGSPEPTVDPNSLGSIGEIVINYPGQ